VVLYDDGCIGLVVSFCAYILPAVYLHGYDSCNAFSYAEAVVNRGQGSTMSSPMSDPHAELRLSLPSNSMNEGRRGGGVLRTYGEGTSGRLRLEIEPASAISRSGSLTNGTSVPKVLLERSFPSFCSAFLLHCEGLMLSAAACSLSYKLNLFPECSLYIISIRDGTFLFLLSCISCATVE